MFILMSAILPSQERLINLILYPEKMTNDEITLIKRGIEVWGRKRCISTSSAYKIILCSLSPIKIPEIRDWSSLNIIIINDYYDNNIRWHLFQTWAAVAQQSRSTSDRKVAGLSCMLKCPWVRYWTPHWSSVRALRWAGDLSREYLALRQGWDWLQQQHPVTPWKGISGYGQWHEMTKM